MGLLTTPWNPQNPTSLAQLVMQGLGLMQKNQAMSNQVAQQETENYEAESKQAAVNMINLANIQAKNREAALDAQMTASNVDLNKAKMAYYLGLGKGGLLNGVSGVPDTPAPGTILSDGGQGGMPSSGGFPAAPQNPTIPIRSDATGTASATGAPGVLPSIQPDATTNTATDVGNAALSAAAGSAAPAGLLMPSATNMPTLMRQAQPAPAQPDKTETPRQGYDDLLKLHQDSAAAFKTDAGMTWQDALKPDSKATAQQKQDASQIQRLDDQLQQAKQSPAKTVENVNDLSKLPYDKMVATGGTGAVMRQKVGGVDQLQYFDRIGVKGPDGVTKYQYKPQGAPKPIMPESMSNTPMQVMIPKDKVQAYDTAKFWLEKIYSGMDVKAKAANRDQAMKMHDIMVQLGNDADVQGHLRTMGFKDAVPPPGMEVAGYNADLKDNTQVPFFRKIKPEEEKAKSEQDKTIKSLWAEYKNWRAVADSDSKSTTTTEQERKAAQIKADTLFKTIQQMTAPGVRPGQQPPGGPGSASYYYGQ